MLKAHQRNTGTWRTKCGCREGEMTSEKHQPFEQNMRKDEKVMAQNIEGHSEEVGLHTGTNSMENDQVSMELRPCGWTKGATMGHKN